jgi:hypothetical protein
MKDFSSDARRELDKFMGKSHFMSWIWAGGKPILWVEIAIRVCLYHARHETYSSLLKDIGSAFQMCIDGLWEDRRRDAFLELTLISWEYKVKTGKNVSWDVGACASMFANVVIPEHWNG